MSSPAAIERARVAWSGISWGTQMSWPQAEVEKVIAAFAAAIDAAASEARAAGYAEGIEKSAAHQPLSAETSERIWRLASDLDSTNPGHTEARLVELVAGSLTRERELRYRALATPAQSET